MRFLRRFSGYALTDTVRNITTLNALEIHVLEERIQVYKNRWHYRMLGMDFSRLNQTNRLRNYGKGRGRMEGSP
jgi:hypothetical protein